MRLKNWYLTSFSNVCIMHGVVDNHPNLGAGVFINTSPCKQACLDEKNKTLTILTASGSTYIMSYDDISTLSEELENTRASLPKLNISSVFVDKAVVLAKKKEEIVKESLVNQLINGDLYLEVNSNGFEGVYFKYNDKVFRLRCSVHSGMFSNSHLYKLSGVVDFRHYEFRCRYVTTYHFSDTIKRMVVNNISSVEITIDNKSYPVGISTTDITEDSYSEGLISPDCVDGKSCFNCL